MAGPPVAERIRAGLLAFAAGDALGAPYVGLRAKEIPRAKRLEPGGVTEVTAELLRACCPVAAGDEPGAGAWGAATDNRVLLRAVAVGWAVSEPSARRAAMLRLAAPTHAPVAAWAAVLAADLAAWALEGRVLRHAVYDAADGWVVPARGVPVGARETLEALLALVARHAEPEKALRAAVKTGGETSVLAALAGAVLGVRDPWAVDRLPWSVDAAVVEQLDAAAQALARLRGGA